MEPLGQRIFFVSPDLGLGLLVLVVALPALFRLVPRNAFYGFRVPKAFESDEAWYRINQEGARRLLPWSAFLLVTGIIKWFSLDWIGDHIDERWLGLFLGGPVVFACIMILISIVRYARQVAKE
ncbi:MAG TPA: SdpI family protein [Candidatus Bathyarchaeia archaeon]|nr:SdpI family protein [Candidatus Bathyarchaeia archaeon]